MTRTPVKSSQINSIGYDPKTKTLEIEFTARGKFPESVYQYYDVSPLQHAALMKDHSQGSHHAKHIKGKFKFTKIS